jgi:hypothetical protein
VDPRGTILALARNLSQLMSREGIPGVVLGGIAVVLHGYLSTPVDIEVVVDQLPATLEDLLIAEGFQFDESRREFVRQEVRVRFVPSGLLAKPPRRTVEIEGIVTVSLADLIEMKLERGSRDCLRAQDLADVIGLIRRHDLNGDFAHQIDQSLRPTFRKLVNAIRQGGRD